MVRIKDNYPDWEFVGVEAVILRDGGEAVLVGFPLDSPFGWYDETMSTEYNLRYILSDYIEFVQVFSKSKFR